jgi:Bacterial mobilisation protein (MobC)
MCCSTKNTGGAGFLSRITLGKGATPPLHPREQGRRPFRSDVLAARSMPPRRQSGEAFIVSDAPATTPQKRTAPWRGRPRVRDPKARRVAVRLTIDQWAKLDSKATAAGLQLGGYLRSVALGSVERQSAAKLPLIDRQQLARLLGELGKLGSNVNQIAKAFNSVGAVPAVQELMAIRTDMMAMRVALMTALGCEP